MLTSNTFLSYLRFSGTVFLQLVLTQVITFIASLTFPDTESYPQNHSIFFAFILGITFSFGVFLGGWLALRLHWLAIQPRFLARFLVAMLGAYLPLIIALLVYPMLEPGNPFFLISILTSILGFYVPGGMNGSG